ncbi:Abi family protein [Caenispirillum bisanense]
MNMDGQGYQVKAFVYADDVLDDIERSLSPERFARYLNATQGNRKAAVHLYTWNTAVSAAFYGPLQGLEIALRNAMHRHLSAVYGTDWYDNPAAGLDQGATKQIADAKNKLKGKYTVDAPHIVASLSFGFWVALLGRGGKFDQSESKANYEMTLWRPALRAAFTTEAPLKRRDAHEPLDYLRTLRNRIAHHEPIFERHLEKDHDGILQITGWLSPSSRDWIAHHSRVPALLRQGRHAPTYF